MEYWKIALVCLVAYLFGSVTFATIISKKMTGTDIRTVGSRNPGMSNMITSIGAKAGYLTFLGDFLKGLFAVLCGYLIFGSKSLLIGALAALVAMIGHLYPVFFGFRGGKGTAVMGGALLGIDPIMFLVIIAFFLFFLLTTKYIAVATLVAAVVYPVYLFCIGAANEKVILLILALCVSVLSTTKHIENFYRIKKGEEIKFSPELLLKKKG